MQDKWKDLIPFYVAGTLSDEDKQALEAYLIQCGDPCNNEVEEWRTIASATWQHANTHALTLPPLSQAVRDEVAKDAPLRASGKIVTSNEFRDDSMTQGSAPVYPRHVVEQNQRVRRPSRVPLTMVAAFMTMVIFGGILLSQLKPGDLDPQTIIELTDVGDNVTPIASEQFGGEVAILPETPDSGIVQTPTKLAPQPTTTPLPPPTSTPVSLQELPQNAGGGLLDNSSIAALPSTGACTIRNDTQGALTTYRNASFEAEPVGIMRQGETTEIYVTFNGWYMLSYGYWVFADNLTVYGDCSQLWTATPTAIGDTSGNDSGGVVGGIPQCVVRNDGTEPINLYQWANYDSPVNGRFAVGDEVDVQIGANGWYQVFYAQWVNGAEVTVEGAGCNQLWIPTATIPAATRTPISGVDGTVAIVTTEYTILRGSPGAIGVFIEQINQGANMQVIAHNNVSGSQRWYLVQSAAGRTGWVPSLDVDVIPSDLGVLPAATVPVIPTSTPVGFVPTPTIENWSHIATITEHGCGGTVGAQSTIATQLQRLGTQVNFIYPETGTSFVLEQVAPNTYSGSYGAAANIEVSLSFSSSTTYTATETVTHESGCVVRSTWSGTKQQ